jgi:hypothetical protein
MSTAGDSRASDGPPGFQHLVSGEFPDFVPVHPPKGWLVASAALIGVSLLALLALPGTLVAHLAGYLTAGWLAVAAVALFSRYDNSRRRNACYAPQPKLAPLVPALSVLAVLVASGHGYFIANELARR